MHFWRFPLCAPMPEVRTARDCGRADEHAWPVSLEMGLKKPLARGECYKKVGRCYERASGVGVFSAYPQVCGLKDS